ncbi:MAG TPA: DUF4249 family protein [Bacteroidia bacterium]|jgi:hypothetical protein|nr:DUF4249 family protein [Bacteroidia bacterium]
MKKTILNILFAVCSLLIISSCTSVIKVDVPKGSTLIVIDAFLNNNPEPQKVRLTTTADYFSNAPTPPVLGATVTLNDLTNNTTYTFSPDGNGNYIHSPLQNDSMAQVHHKYQLNVSYNGNNYFALSTLNRTTTVRAIFFRGSPYDPFGLKPPSDTTNPRVYYPIVFVVDSTGPVEDYYWLKTYKNDVFYNEPDVMKVFPEAGYDHTDGDTLGLQFCFYGLTPKTDQIHKYDIFRADLYSIDKDTYSYLSQLQTQLTNSQSGLFAVTPQNVKTNIQQTAGTQKAIGWFNMGAVSSRSQIAK